MQVEAKLLMEKEREKKGGVQKKQRKENIQTPKPSFELLRENFIRGKYFCTTFKESSGPLTRASGESLRPNLPEQPLVVRGQPVDAALCLGAGAAPLEAQRTAQPPLPEHVQRLAAGAQPPAAIQCLMVVFLHLFLVCPLTDLSRLLRSTPILEFCLANQCCAP